jgi:hypothetical protein
VREGTFKAHTELRGDVGLGRDEADPELPGKIERKPPGTVSSDRARPDRELADTQGLLDFLRISSHAFSLDLPWAAFSSLLHN